MSEEKAVLAECFFHDFPDEDDWEVHDPRHMSEGGCDECVRAVIVAHKDWQAAQATIAQQAARIAELEQQRSGVVLPEREEFDKWFRRAQLLSDSIDTTWISEAFLPYRAWMARARLNPPGKFRLGDPVRKIKGSQWSGRIVGTYSTELTPEGYAVESFTEKGSVQIYPASALEACEETRECVAVPVCDTCHDQGEVWTGESQGFSYMSMQPPEPIMEVCPECGGESVALLAQQGKENDQ